MVPFLIMIRNYIDENYLKGYIPNLDSLLFTGETNFNKQKVLAEIEVTNDFINSNYKGLFTRNDLILRSSGTTLSATTAETISDEDKLTRLRWVVEVKTLTGVDKTLTLSGSNDDGVTYTDINTMIIGTSNVGAIISQTLAVPYRRYKVTATVPTGTLDYASSMTETGYDTLYALKWGGIIMFQNYKRVDDQWYLRFTEFKKMYEMEFNKFVVNYGDEVNEEDTIRSNPRSISYLK